MAYISLHSDDIIDQLSDEDLFEELSRRELSKMSPTVTSLLHEIYQLKCDGKDYEKQLSDLIYETIGRIAGEQ